MIRNVTIKIKYVGLVVPSSSRNQLMSGRDSWKR